MSESHEQMTRSMQAALRTKTDAELVEFGAHCRRIGVRSGSPSADAIALELIRRGLVGR